LGLLIRVNGGHRCEISLFGRLKYLHLAIRMTSELDPANADLPICGARARARAHLDYKRREEPIRREKDARKSSDTLN
jgi:hypothetical protein